MVETERQRERRRTDSSSPAETVETAASSSVVPRLATTPSLLAVPRRTEEAETALRREWERTATLIKTETVEHAQRVAQIGFIGRVETEGDRLQQMLESMHLRDLPVFGERFARIMDGIEALIGTGRDAVSEGRMRDAREEFSRAREQLRAIAGLFGDELEVLVRGIPQGFLTNGLDATGLLERIFDAVEAGVPEIGTDREDRYRAMQRLLRTIIQALNSPESQAARELGSQAIELLLRRGEQARAGLDYTQEDMAKDQQVLTAARQMAEAEKPKAGTATHAVHDLSMLTQMQATMTQVISQERVERTRQRFQQLQDEITDLLERARSRPGEELPPDEMRMLVARYRLMMGRTAGSDEMLAETAAGLRGSGAVRDGTAAWFGEQALAALREGNTDIAALAVAVGMLERLAESLPSSRGSQVGTPNGANGAGDYLQSYWRIHDAIRERSPITPDMMARFSTQIEAAGRYIINRGLQE